MRLLLVEDDALLGDGLRSTLARSGYSVDWVQDGDSADRVVNTQPYNLVILDLMLPGRSGLDVLGRMRARRNPVPVIVVTARDALNDRVRALDQGADDYLIKPFEIDELFARLRALHRRAEGCTAPVLIHGEITLSPAAHQVTRGGRPVELSRREFSILQCLMENAGKVMSRQRLEESEYTWGNEPGSNAVEVHIHHLRRKLGSGLIRTVRGVGYLIEQPG